MKFFRNTKAVAVAGAVVLATGTALVGAPFASAAPNGLDIDYDVTGSTTLANPASQVTVNFKPTVLQSTVGLNGSAPYPVTANLPIAPVQSSFKAYGFLPSKGTVVFTQVGPIRGKLGDLSVTPYTLSARASYVVSLRDVSFGGRDAKVGANCQTVKPVVVNATDQGDFNLSSGTLSGTYDLPEFANCGRSQGLINDILPGAGNTLTLKIQISEGTRKAAASLARSGSSS